MPLAIPNFSPLQAQMTNMAMEAGAALGAVISPLNQKGGMAVARMIQQEKGGTATEQHRRRDRAGERPSGQPDEYEASPHRRLDHGGVISLTV